MKPNDKKQEDNSPISDFNGYYQFLNNDFPAWVALDEELYPSVAIAYQASRADNKNIRQQLLEVQTYSKFKEIALSIPNPSDWSHRKHKVMQKLIRDKFKRTKQLGAKLAATHPRKLINSFKQGGENESYWGVVNDKGTNALGKILMGIRQQIIKGDWNQWIIDQGLQIDSKMWPQVSLTVLKDNKPFDKLFLQKKNRFFFGAMASNEFKLDHPSISKVHACIYLGCDLSIMLVDIGSSHGTTLIRGDSTTKMASMKAVCLQKGDLIVFGLSSRKYCVEVSLNKVEQYLKEKQNQIQKERNEIASRMYQSKGSHSRSRSRSPKEKRVK